MNTKRNLTLLSTVFAALALDWMRLGHAGQQQNSGQPPSNAARQAQIRQDGRKRENGPTAPFKSTLEETADIYRALPRTIATQARTRLSRRRCLIFGDAPSINIALIILLRPCDDDATLISYMRDATHKFPGDVSAHGRFWWTAEDRLGQTGSEDSRTPRRWRRKLRIAAASKPKTKIDGEAFGGTRPGVLRRGR